MKFDFDIRRVQETGNYPFGAQRSYRSFSVTGLKHDIIAGSERTTIFRVIEGLAVTAVRKDDRAIESLSWSFGEVPCCGEVSEEEVRVGDPAPPAGIEGYLRYFQSPDSLASPDDPNAAEVVKISTGQLYLVRPGNIRSSRECMWLYTQLPLDRHRSSLCRFNDAMITIRRVPTVEHNFQLVVTRVYEEGDEDLLEDEDESEFIPPNCNDLTYPNAADAERVCLISGELEFHTGVTDGEPTFIWRDLQGDIDELYEFVAIGTNAPTRAFFEMCMYRAMFERKYKRAGDNAVDKELEEFIWQASAEYEVNPIATYSALLSVPAGLHQWNTDTENFEPWGDAVARNDGHEPEYSKKIFTVTWNNIDRDGSQASWVLQFQNLEDFEAFQKLLGQCMWESLNRLPYAKVKSEEQRYIESANEDVEMADPEYEDEDDEEEVLDELDPDAGGSDEESGPEEDEDDVPEMFTNGDFNSQLTVGYKNDRSYVLRGNTLGVFSHTNDDQVKYYNSIKKIGTPKGKEFKPKHVISVSHPERFLNLRSWLYRSCCTIRTARWC
ncbi:VID27 cytoplasmic protein [Salix suchowensis]|nr:VID27 cytoplasmic protein [Salix suchowensis]